jgi:ABC-type Fe3+-hydroxamate transport system substrate-binding protein
MSPAPLNRATTRIGAALAAAALLSVAACGSSQPTKAEEKEQDAAAGGPVTLTDAAGREVVLPAPAEDVVTLEWQQTEDVLTLGVTPVGVADTEGYRTWVSAEELPEGVEDVGMRGEPNPDAIFNQSPDLVIVEEGTDLKKLEKYDVPVLVTAGADAKDPIGQMKETFTLIAQALGKEDVAEEVLADFDHELEHTKEAVEEADPETTEFAYVDAYVMGSTVSIRPFGQGSLVGELGEELGLTNVWKGKVDPAYGLGQTDVEGLAAIGDAQLFYTGTDASTWLDELADNAVWKNAPFVEKDRTEPFPEGTWTFGGPRSSEQLLDAFVQAVA